MYYRSVSMFGVLLLLFSLGCSGNTTIPVVPFEQAEVRETENYTGQQLCCGLWQVVVDPDNETVDIVRLRSADKIINALSFVETEPNWNLRLDDVTGGDYGPFSLNVWVRITHPFPGILYYSGFDARGVVFGPEVKNADGYTYAMVPEHFVDESYGYIDGLLGTPYGDEPSGFYDGLAGYKYYCDGIKPDVVLADFMEDPLATENRGFFKAGNSWQRKFELVWPDDDTFPLVFNYAIYANWAEPLVPYDYSGHWNATCFPIEANAADAIACKVTEAENTLWFYNNNSGGNLSLEVAIWDWDTPPLSVTIKANDVITEDIVVETYSSSTAYKYEYDFDNIPCDVTGAGDVEIMIEAEDQETFNSHWLIGTLTGNSDKHNSHIISYFKYTFNIANCLTPCATGIDPATGYANGEVVEATITGYNFIPGAGLSVELEGPASITAYDEVGVDENTITCKFVVNEGMHPPGIYYIKVTNPCGLSGICDGFFTVCPDPEWAPTMEFSPTTGDNNRARNVDGSTIPHGQSNHRINHFFEVTGLPASSPCMGDTDFDYEYIVSNSALNPEGLTDVWVHWLDDGEYYSGINLIVPWYDEWAQYAPANVWVWIRAVDDSVSTEPYCNSALVIHLADTIREYTIFSQPEWIHEGIGNLDVTYGGTLRFFGQIGSTCDIIAHNTTELTFTDKVVFEMYVPTVWVNNPLNSDNYCIAIHDQAGGGDQGDIFEVTGADPVWVDVYDNYTTPVTDFNGEDRQIGFYIHKHSNSGYFVWYVGSVGVYDVP